MGHSKAKIQAAWDKAQKVRGKDPTKYRKDSCGNLIFRHSYGKLSDMGWELDHKNSKANGGTNSNRNIQALHWLTNRKKGKKSRNYC